MNTVSRREGMRDKQAITRLPQPPDHGSEQHSKMYHVRTEAVSSNSMNQGENNKSWYGWADFIMQSVIVEDSCSRQNSLFVQCDSVIRYVQLSRNTLFYNVGLQQCNMTGYIGM